VQGEVYQVNCDDAAHDDSTWLRVTVANDGDVHVFAQEWPGLGSPEEDGRQNPDPFPSIRVRTWAGGGRNCRTRQALLWLARAIQLDAEDQAKAGRGRYATASVLGVKARPEQPEGTGPS
jgi:hypothetical protein